MVRPPRTHFPKQSALQCMVDGDHHIERDDEGARLRRSSFHCGCREIRHFYHDETHAGTHDSTTRRQVLKGTSTGDHSVNQRDGRPTLASWLSAAVVRRSARRDCDSGNQCTWIMTSFPKVCPMRSHTVSAEAAPRQ